MYNVHARSPSEMSRNFLSDLSSWASHNNFHLSTMKVYLMVETFGPLLFPPRIYCKFLHSLYAKNFACSVGHAGWRVYL